MKNILSLFLVALAGCAFAQDNPFSFSQRNYGYDVQKISKYPEYFLKANAPPLNTLNNKNSFKTSPFVEDSIYSYVWDTTATSPILRFKSFFTYNNKGNKTMIIGQRYDTNFVRDLYYYDNNENLTVALQQMWNDAGNNWRNSSRDSSVYDTNNRKAIEFIHIWNDSTNNWRNLWKTIYTYDSKGNETTAITQSWDHSGSTITTSKDSSTYDNKNNRIEYTHFDWDSVTNRWKTGMQYFYSYNNKGNITESQGAKWDTITNSWKTVSRGSYTYDSNGNNILREGQYLDTISNKWEKDWRGLYTYDSNGNMIMVDGQHWNAILDKWENREYDMRQIYTYDNNGNNTAMFIQAWDTLHSYWLNFIEEKYFWSLLSTGIREEDNNRKSLIFENPYIIGSPIDCSKLKIGESYQLSLYNILGEQVYVTHFIGGNPEKIGIVISKQLPQGLYIMRLNSKEENTTYKIVIQPK